MVPEDIRDFFVASGGAARPLLLSGDRTPARQARPERPAIWPRI